MPSWEQAAATGTASYVFMYKALSEVPCECRPCQFVELCKRNCLHVHAHNCKRQLVSAQIFNYAQRLPVLSSAAGKISRNP